MYSTAGLYFLVEVETMIAYFVIAYLNCSAC
jgi:hypothetical protein